MMHRSGTDVHRLRPDQYYDYCKPSNINPRKNHKRPDQQRTKEGRSKSTNSLPDKQRSIHDAEGEGYINWIIQSSELYESSSPTIPMLPSDCTRLEDTELDLSLSFQSTNSGPPGRRQPAMGRHAKSYRAYRTEPAVWHQNTRNYGLTGLPDDDWLEDTDCDVALGPDVHTTSDMDSGKIFMERSDYDETVMSQHLGQYRYDDHRSHELSDDQPLSGYNNRHNHNEQTNNRVKRSYSHRRSLSGGGYPVRSCYRQDSVEHKTPLSFNSSSGYESSRMGEYYSTPSPDSEEIGEDINAGDVGYLENRQHRITPQEWKSQQDLTVRTTPRTVQESSARLRRKSRAERRKTIASISADEIQDMTHEDHRDFRDRIRNALGLAKPAKSPTDTDKDTSLSFRSPHKQSCEMLHKRLQRVLDMPADRTLTAPSSRLRDRTRTRRERTKSMPVDIKAYFSLIQSTPWPPIQQTPHEPMSTSQEMDEKVLDLSVDTMVAASDRMSDIRYSITSSYEELHRLFRPDIKGDSVSNFTPNETEPSLCSLSDGWDRSVRAVTETPVSEVYIDEISLVEYQLGLRDDLPAIDISEDNLSDDSSPMSHKHCRNVPLSNHKQYILSETEVNLSDVSQDTSDKQCASPIRHKDCMLSRDNTLYNKIKGISALHGENYNAKDFNTAILNNSLSNSICQNDTSLEGVISCSKRSVCKHHLHRNSDILQQVTDRYSSSTQPVKKTNRIKGAITATVTTNTESSLYGNCAESSQSASNNTSTSHLDVELSSEELLDHSSHSEGDYSTSFNGSFDGLKQTESSYGTKVLAHISPQQGHQGLSTSCRIENGNGEYIERQPDIHNTCRYYYASPSQEVNAYHNPQGKHKHTDRLTESLASSSHYDIAVSRPTCQRKSRRSLFEEQSHKSSMMDSSMTEDISQRPAALRLSAYGFVISEKASPHNKPSAVVRPVNHNENQDAPPEPTYKQMSLSKNMISPMDSLAANSPGKNLGYFLQFDTPKSSQSRSRSRKRTADKQKAARKSQSTPRKLPVTENAIEPEKKTTKVARSGRTERAGSASPARRRSSSLADSMNRFKELQQMRQNLTTPTDDVFDKPPHDEPVMQYSDSEIVYPEKENITPVLTKEPECSNTSLQASLNDGNTHFTSDRSNESAIPSNVLQASTGLTFAAELHNETDKLDTKETAISQSDRVICAMLSSPGHDSGMSNLYGEVEVIDGTKPDNSAEDPVSSQQDYGTHYHEADQLDSSIYRRDSSEAIDKILPPQSNGNGVSTNGKTTPTYLNHSTPDDFSQPIFSPQTDESSMDIDIIDHTIRATDLEAVPNIATIDIETDLVGAGESDCESDTPIQELTATQIIEHPPYLETDLDNLVETDSSTSEYCNIDGPVNQTCESSPIENDSEVVVLTNRVTEAKTSEAHLHDYISPINLMAMHQSEPEIETDQSTTDYHLSSDNEGNPTQREILNNQARLSISEQLSMPEFQLHIRNNLECIQAEEDAAAIKDRCSENEVDSDEIISSKCSLASRTDEDGEEDNSNIDYSSPQAMNKCSLESKAVSSGIKDFEQGSDTESAEISDVAVYRESTPSRDEMDMMVKRNLLHLNQEELESVNVALQLSNTDCLAATDNSLLSSNGDCDSPISNPTPNGRYEIDMEHALADVTDYTNETDIYQESYANQSSQGLTLPTSNKLTTSHEHMIVVNDEAHYTPEAELDVDHEDDSLFSVGGSARPSYQEIFQKLSTDAKVNGHTPAGDQPVEYSQEQTTSQDRNSANVKSSNKILRTELPLNNNTLDSMPGVGVRCQSDDESQPRQTDSQQVEHSNAAADREISSDLISETAEEPSEGTWEQEAYIERINALEYYLGGHTDDDNQQDCWMPSKRRGEAEMEVHADTGSIRSTSSSRKSWIKQLSQRYETWEDVQEDETAHQSKPNEQQGASDSVSTEHTDDPASDQSADSDIEAEKCDGDTYSVEILGGEEPPDEWMSLSERKASPVGSVDLESQTESELVGRDNWRLTERDNETLEVDMRQEAGDLYDQEVSLASEEESMMQTPAPSHNGSIRVTETSGEAVRSPTEKRISAPTSFPSNFSTIRSGKATERFEERMKTIEHMNSLKSKSRFAPVVATIGRFSSAFRRFEGKEERRHSVEIQSTPALKAAHSSLTASVSIGSEKKTITHVTSPTSPTGTKKLPRSPYHASLPRDIHKTGVSPRQTKSVQSSTPPLRKQIPVDQPDNNQGDASLSRSAKVTPPLKQTAPKSRTVNIPVESGRMVRSVRESTTNAPDVVAAALQQRPREKTPVEEYSEPQFELTTQSQPPVRYEAPPKGARQTPHYDIDIVIKREPLPAGANPDDFKELPTAAITLSRDEVKVMKIDSMPRTLTPSEVITVWDTEVPVKDTREKVIPPQKLHVTHLNKNIQILSPTNSNPDSLRALISPPPLDDKPTIGTHIRAPVVLRSKGADEQKPKPQPSSTEPLSVSIRPQHTSQPERSSAADRQRSKSHDDLLSPKMRTSLAFEPETKPVMSGLVRAIPARTSNRLGISSHERAIPARKPSPRLHSGENRSPIIEDAFDYAHVPTQQLKPRQAAQARSVQRQSEQRQQPRQERVVEKPEMSSSKSPVRPGIVKSDSLEELRSRGGLVSDVKGVFNNPHESRMPDYGESVYSKASSQPQRRTRLPSEDRDYTRKWVEDSPPPTQSQSVAPLDDQKPWYMQRDPSSQKPTGVMVESSLNRVRDAPRGRQKRGGGPRSKSLGRTPTKAIAEMANFFQKEAELSEIGVSSSPVQFQGRAITPEIQHDHTTTKAVPRNRSPSPQVDRRPVNRTYSPEPYYDERAIDCNPPSSDRQTYQQQRPHQRIPSQPQNRKQGSRQDARRNDDRDIYAQPRQNEEKVQHSPNAPAAGVNSFIKLYNKTDEKSRFAKPSMRPDHCSMDYDEVVVDEIRPETRHQVMSQRERSPRSHRPRHQDQDIMSPRSRDSEQETSRSWDAEQRRTKDQGEIDDRPLAASAFKAWLGSPERSRLEDKVEDAYQKHVVRRDGPQAKPRPKSEREAPKSEPWWKQQNKIADAQKKAHTPKSYSPPQSPRRQRSPVRYQEPLRRERSASPQPFQQQRTINDRVNNHPNSSPQNSQASHSPYRGQRDNDSYHPTSQGQVNQIATHEINHSYEPQRHRYPDETAPTARDGEYSPYANYRIPLSDGPRSTVRQEPPVEDYYAQIRKKPAERTQSADLLVDIPPPKPQRQSLHQSDDRLYVPQQENMQRQREYVEPVIHTRVDNQTYFDPYSTIEPEPPLQQPPAQHMYQPAGQGQHNGYPGYAPHGIPGGDPNHSYRAPDPPADVYHPTTRGGYQEPPQRSSLGRPDHAYPQESQYRPEQNYPSAQQLHWRPPHNDPRMAQRPYHTLDHRYSHPQRRSYQPEPVARQEPRQWNSATVDRRDPRNHNRYPTEPQNRPDMRLSQHQDPRSNSSRYSTHDPRHSYRNVDPRNYPEMRGNQRPDLVPVDPRQQRARSVPNTRPSQRPRETETRDKQSSLKRSENDKLDRHNEKPDKKSKEKQSKSKNSKNNKENKQKQTPIVGSSLPDFIPIHHVSEQAFHPRNEQNSYRQGYDPAYGQHRQDSYHQQASYNSRNRHAQSTYVHYPGRARPGVGVMFNPEIGTTDF